MSGEERTTTAVLEARGRLLARRPRPKELDTEAMLVLAVAGERYAVPLASTREIQRSPALVAVPGLDRRWLGVVHVRGELRPVLDLARARDGGDGRGAGGEAVVVHVEAGGVVVGLLVDELPLVQRLPRASLAPPAAAGSWVVGSVRAADGGVVSLLDPAGAARGEPGHRDGAPRRDGQSEEDEA